MGIEKRAESYSWEEVPSFDRLKKAMTRRVLDRIEPMWKTNEPMSPEQRAEAVNDERQKMKQVVRSSPAGREAFYKYLECAISEQIDRLIQKGRPESESLVGVSERSI